MARKDRGGDQWLATGTGVLLAVAVVWGLGAWWGLSLNRSASTDEPVSTAERQANAAELGNLLLLGSIVAAGAAFFVALRNNRIALNANRPWLSMSRPDVQQTFNGLSFGRADANVIAEVINTGGRPATGVHFFAVLRRVNGPYRSTLTKAFEEWLLERVKLYERSTDAAIVVPGAPAALGPVPVDEMPSDALPMVFPHYHLFGCLFYRDPADPSAVHYTASAWHVTFNVHSGQTWYKSGEEAATVTIVGIAEAT